MKLSTPKPGLGLHRRGNCSAHQARQDGAQVVSAVEAVLHFGQISACIFDELHRVVGAAQCRLQIAKHSVDGPKLLKLHGPLAAAGDGAIVDSWGAPTLSVTVKQPSPSETTVSGSTVDLAMNSSNDALVNGPAAKHAR